MEILKENPWITAGMTSASCVLGTLLGERLLKAVLPAMLLGSCFTAAALLRGDIGPSTLRDWGLFLILFLVSASDLRQFEIPDRPLIGGVLLWVFWLILGGLLKDMDVLCAALSGGFAAVCFSAVLLALALVMDHLFRKETLGGGDIKLIFMVMLHLGVLRGFLCLVLSLVSGLLFILIRRDRRIPWAPSIAAGTLISLFMGTFLLDRGFLLFSS